MLYGRALQEAGVTAPLIALAEQPAHPFGDWARVEPAGNDALLQDVHESVLQLARAGSADAPLRDAAAVAIEQLHAVQRALP